MSTESKQAASKLIESLLAQNMIGDAKVLNSQTGTKLVEVKMVTADDRVNDVVEYIKENNPNSSNTDMGASLVSSELKSGTQEYASMIKDKTS